MLRQHSLITTNNSTEAKGPNRPNNEPSLSIALVSSGEHSSTSACFAGPEGLVIELIKCVPLHRIPSIVKVDKKIRLGVAFDGLCAKRKIIRQPAELRIGHLYIVINLQC